MNALDELLDLSRKPFNEYLENGKSSNERIIGYLCNHVPEEILYAAGLIPYRISPTGCTESGDADAYLSRLNCTFCRSCLQFAMDGKFDFLDGLVAVNPCDHMRRLWDVWRLKVGCDFTHMLSLPHRISESAERWYLEETEMLRDSVEKAFEVEITDEKLAGAIELYNTTRALLSKIYELRKRKAPPLKGGELTRILVGVLRAPRIETNRLLKDLLAEAENRQGISDYAARLMVIGGACDSADFIDVIEDLGGLVVADTLCFGSRYFWQPVESDGNPMSSLATAYLNQPPCAGMVGGERERLDFALDMAKQFRVDGIIFQKLRWCDLWGGRGCLHREETKGAGHSVSNARERILAERVGTTQNPNSGFSGDGWQLKRRVAGWQLSMVIQLSMRQGPTAISTSTR